MNKKKKNRKNPGTFIVAVTFSVCVMCFLSGFFCSYQSFNRLDLSHFFPRVWCINITWVAGQYCVKRHVQQVIVFVLWLWFAGLCSWKQLLFFHFTQNGIPNGQIVFISFCIYFNSVFSFFYFSFSVFPFGFYFQFCVSFLRTGV